MEEQIRYNQLRSEERMTIESMKLQVASTRAMARVLGRPASTVSREVSRNSCPGTGYTADSAQALHATRGSEGALSTSSTYEVCSGVSCVRCCNGSGRRSRLPLPSRAYSPTNPSATCPTRRSTRPSTPSPAASCADNSSPAFATGEAPACRAAGAPTGEARFPRWSASMCAGPR